MERAPLAFEHFRVILRTSYGSRLSNGLPAVRRIASLVSPFVSFGSRCRVIFTLHVPAGSGSPWCRCVCPGHHVDGVIGFTHVIGPGCNHLGARFGLSQPGMMVDATQFDERPAIALAREAPDLIDRSGGVGRSVDELDGEIFRQGVCVSADIAAIQDVPQRGRRGHEVVFDEVPGNVTGYVPHDEREYRPEDASYPDADDDGQHHVGEEPAPQSLSEPPHCTPLTLVRRQADQYQPFDLARMRRGVCEGESGTEGVADEDERRPASQRRLEGRQVLVECVMGEGPRRVTESEEVDYRGTSWKKPHTFVGRPVSMGATEPVEENIRTGRTGCVITEVSVNDLHEEFCRAVIRVVLGVPCRVLAAASVDLTCLKHDRPTP